MSLMCVLLLGACTAVVQCMIAEYETYKPKPILYCDGKTLAEIVLGENGEMTHCRLHELEEPSDAEPIIKGSGLQVKYPNFKEMLQLINECTFLEKPAANSTDNTTSSLEVVSTWSAWSLWNGILPGTKWCGVGDIADSFEELGSQTEVDACCRAHDHCPVKLKAFRTGYGMINLSLYTKSHCDCDKEFYSCLKASRNKVADVVGNLYFNIMKIQCIKEHRPFVCTENSDFLKMCV
ncbi:Acidic phospholipase A2 PA4 like protein [Argiope bruennichi]|uniref:Phospholipase A2 n=1 Tax=Argiope bruennichi TaxID=94029 RepID=A0A8T0E4V4_ARGBR|nr:Acidic phospholipase A2 PA4 like protein [Argiope bruennichi]